MVYSKLALMFECRLDDDGKQDLEVGQTATEEQDVGQTAAEEQKEEYAHEMEIAEQIEDTDFMMVVRDLQEGFKARYNLDITPQKNSVYSLNVAESWEEVNYAHFMLFLHVIYLKASGKDIYGDNGPAEEQTFKGNDVTSNESAKCQQRVLENWNKSREKVFESKRANISRVLSSAIYDWKVSFGDILGEGTSAFRAMHKAYYKLHNEAWGVTVNNFHRDVSDVAWTEGVEADLFAIAMDQILLEVISGVLEVVRDDNQIALDKLLQCITKSADSYLKKSGSLRYESLWRYHDSHRNVTVGYHERGRIGSRRRDKA